MKLSVVIVNYNVEHFLEQCLLSVRRAMRGIDGEVFVVDNNSVDGSLKMLASKFPEVKVIANKENVGFSRANNQAIRVSDGEYVLLLNPDTVVEDDTFVKVIAFMDSHPDAGGLGVKMVDGKGCFLPESKRGLPTPMTAFYKIFGLSKLFPKSKRFGRYHLGFLDENETNEVDVLAGAFMLMRRAALDKSGLLDETFFMYGEDIDMSYRITLAGYKNYYFHDTRIIHYKGESTKKTSVNYVIVFYKAMEIFAKKHFAKDGAWFLSLLINTAIYLRAGAAIFSRFLSCVAQPVIEAVVGFAGLVAISGLWGHFSVYDGIGNYPQVLFTIVTPLYIIVWLLSSYIIGSYDRPYRSVPSIIGNVLGMLVILVIYALLPEEMRFSRALILFGTVWMCVVSVLTRGIGRLAGFANYKPEHSKHRFLVVGNADEARRVAMLLESTAIKPDYICNVLPNEDAELPEGYVGCLRQVPDIAAIYKIDEVIFCAKDVPNAVIIDKMVAWQELGLDYKIAPEDTLSIIGSNSINTRGDLYTVDVNTIVTVRNKRRKRLFDLSVACVVVFSWPLIAWFVKKPVSLLKNGVKVLLGRRTWVGFCSCDARLPILKKHVFTTDILLKNKEIDSKTAYEIDVRYAQDYKLVTDLNIFLEAVKKH